MNRSRHADIILLVSLCVFLIATLAWASLAEVELAAVAPGRVVPTGQVKVIRSFEQGKIRRIAVEEGSLVERDSVLIEFDTTLVDAEISKLTAELGIKSVEAARLEATLNWRKDQPFRPPAGAPPEIISINKALMADQIAAHRAHLHELDGTMAEQRAQRRTIEAALAKQSRLLPILQERTAMRETLFHGNHGSRLALIEEQERLVELEGNIALRRTELAKTKASLKAIEAQKERAVAEFYRQRRSALAAVRERMIVLREDIRQAREHRARHTLLSPVDGVVQDLAVHTENGMVEPGARLMVIVPRNAGIRVEAFVANTDIGFVKPGQRVILKVTSFDFRRYGAINGTVSYVGHDAVNAGAQSGPPALTDIANGVAPANRRPNGRSRVQSHHRTRSDLHGGRGATNRTLARHVVGGFGHPGQTTAHRIPPPAPSGLPAGCFPREVTRLAMANETRHFPETADPAAWEPHDLDRSVAWRHRFTDTELAELPVSLRENHLDELDGMPARPLLASQMAVTARELKSGLGFRILRGLPSGDMTERELARAFRALSRLLGEPAEQPGGVTMAHVRAEAGSRDRLGFRAAGALPFHADPEDVIGFLCVQPSRKGGTRRLASAATVYNILAAEHPDLLEVLTQPFYVALTHPHPDHGHPWTRLPFLSLRDGVFNACAYPVHIRRAQKLAGVPELTKRQNRALDVFDTVADRVAVSLELEAGDIEYFNNHVVLHSRTGFAAEGTGRHLLRVWLSIAGFRPLDPNHPARLKERRKGSDKG